MNGNTIRFVIQKICSLILFLTCVWLYTKGYHNPAIVIVGVIACLEVLSN